MHRCLRVLNEQKLLGKSRQERIHDELLSSLMIMGETTLQQGQVVMSR